MQSNKTIKTRKKILIVIPRLVYGGAERVIVILNKYLKDYYDISLVLLTNQMNFKYNGKIIIMPFRIGNTFLEKIFNFFRRLKALKKIINSEQPDVVLSFTESANFLTILSQPKSVALILGVRNYMSISANRNLFTRIFYKKGIKILYRYADRVFTNSKDAANDLVENFNLPKENVSWIHNPVDFHYISKKKNEPLNLPLQFNNGVPVIINVGRFCRQKGQSDLIRAFAMVREKLEARLILIGDGELRKDFENQIRELSLEHDVYLPGFVHNVFPYLSKSNLFVLSSYYEGFPNALIEAMAMGLPVVSYDCHSGPNEILENGRFGSLVSVGDYKTLADKISLFAKDEAMRNQYGDISFKRARAFDPIIICGIYKEMIDEEYNRKKM